MPRKALYPVRLVLPLDESIVADIDEWRYDQRIPSRVEAMRRLLRLGLTAHAAGFAPVLESNDQATFDQLRAMLKEFEQ